MKTLLIGFLFLLSSSFISANANATETNFQDDIAPPARLEGQHGSGVNEFNVEGKGQVRDGQLGDEHLSDTGKIGTSKPVLLETTEDIRPPSPQNGDKTKNQNSVN